MIQTSFDDPLHHHVVSRDEETLLGAFLPLILLPKSLSAIFKLISPSADLLLEVPHVFQQHISFESHDISLIGYHLYKVSRPSSVPPLP